MGTPSGCRPPTSFEARTRRSTLIMGARTPPSMRGATEYEACAAVPARRMNSEEMLAEEEAFVSENRASPTLFTL